MQLNPFSTANSTDLKNPETRDDPDFPAGPQDMKSEEGEFRVRECQSQAGGCHPTDDGQSG